jgi:pimeloyl-ACP methyl ester carboxylesterase
MTLRTRIATLAALAGLATAAVLVVPGPAAANGSLSTPDRIASAAHQAGATVAQHSGTKPTIVLVHGAWADASSWSEVTRRLQKKGYQVLVPPNPLRGLASDAAYIEAFVQQRTSGPVVLVGHSYGGAVITNDAADPDVRALVYINAFAPDEGENTLELATALPGSDLAGDPLTLFDFVAYPGAPAGDFDLYIKPAVFRHAFGNDLPVRTADVLGASQRAITFSAGAAPSGPPAWKRLPSWYLVGTADNVIPPAQQRAMAQRAGSQTSEVRAGHLSMLSRPDAVTSVILAAARSVG